MMMSITLFLMSPQTWSHSICRHGALSCSGGTQNLRRFLHTDSNPCNSNNHRQFVFYCSLLYFTETCWHVLPSVIVMHCPHGLLWLLHCSTWDPWDGVPQELWQSRHALCKWKPIHIHRSWTLQVQSLFGSHPLSGWMQISSGCTSGCMCPQGLVSDGAGGCIKESSCPCVYNGQTYKPGDTLTKDCNTWFVQFFGYTPVHYVAEWKYTQQKLLWDEHKWSQSAF